MRFPMPRPTAQLVFLAVILFSATATAQTWPSLQSPSSVQEAGANDVALLVAVEDYAFLPDVPGAAANVAAWERFLRQDVGVPTVLVLKDQQAVREEILDFARRAAGATSEDGRLWFVFVGHGAPNKDGNDGLLIGADGQQTMSSMMARSVGRAELLAALESGKQRETVAILDACFSGRDAEGNALAKGVQPVLPVDADLDTPSGTVVLTAASANEVAGQLPDAERPAFSYLVLGAMRGWADDGDGNVTAAEATAFASSELLGVSGRQQTPQLSGLDQMVLSRGATEPRPQSVVAAPEPSPNRPDVTRPAPEPAPDELERSDDQPKIPFYAKVGVGYGGPGVLGDASIAAAGDFGLKLNAITDMETEYRAAIWVNYFSQENDATPEPGTTIETTEGDQLDVDDGDPVTNARNHIIQAGVGPGIAWRSRSGVTYVDSNVGIATFVGGECTRWQAEVLTRDGVCETSTDRSEFYGGLRAGYSYSFLDVALVASFIADIGLVGSLNLGLSYDL